jgi:hypothetical protein
LTENAALAVGVVHSHPRGSLTHPSSTDDQMDLYYASYFNDFARDRPYVSLIFGEREQVVFGTGRVCWRGQWRTVERFLIDGVTITVDDARHFAR